MESYAARRARLRCDICAVGQGEPTFRGPAKVLRFELVHQTETAENRPTKRGVGVMHLCERCWAATAARRRRPHRRSNAPNERTSYEVAS